MRRVITVLMDLPADNDSHRFTVDALDHAIAALDAPILVRVLHTDAVDDLGDGVVIGPGSPYLDAAGAEDAIQTAREKGLPLVGT
jgi:CTP synthase (UTP-ammonia lyase)